LRWLSLAFFRHKIQGQIVENPAASPIFKKNPRKPSILKPLHAASVPLDPKLFLPCPSSTSSAQASQRESQMIPPS